MGSKACALAIAWIVGATVAGQGASHKDLAETCRALRSLPVTDEASFGIVPPRAKALLKDLKAEMRDLVASVVATVELGPDTKTQARERIVHALADRGVVVGADPDYDGKLGYGYVSEVAVELPSEQSTLLAVTVSLTIPCGTDASLYLFRRKAARWDSILVDEVTSYSEISGARDEYQFQVSPQRADGSFTVLSANVPAFCASVWHPLRYRLHEVPSDRPPVLLLAADISMTAVDEGYTLQTIQDGFALTYTIPDDVSTGLVRETLTLKVKDGKVTSRKSRGG